MIRREQLFEEFFLIKDFDRTHLIFCKSTVIEGSEYGLTESFDTH